MRSVGRYRNDHPLILASRNAQSWTEVLDVYHRCCGYLRGVYTPTTRELTHALRLMPTSWSVSLFYYSVVKDVCGIQQPNNAVASTALRQYKHCGNVNGLRRVFEEDINTQGLDGARSTILLASYLGMWERALQVLRSDPSLISSAPHRRQVIGALCQSGLWKQALELLHQPPYTPPSPQLIRPIVKQLSLHGEHHRALVLTAQTLAHGYTLDVSLFSALIGTLRDTGQWKAALETVQDSELLSMSKEDAKRHYRLFSSVVDCLYLADPYGNVRIEDIVKDVTARMQPRQAAYRPKGGRRQFRLCTHNEVFEHYGSVALPLSHLFTRVIGISRWYTRSLSSVVEQAVESNNVIVVMDTNILIQCVAQNVPLVHFFPAMKRQYPCVERFNFATVVVPFTVIQEAYHLVWNPANRVRHSVKLLLWSRLVAFLKQPTVYPLALMVELLSSSLSVVSRMAYAKMDTTVAGKYEQDPDLRVLNVCLSLQHFLRQRALASYKGPHTSEGIMLFAFLKYHVRRYNNAVKGSGSDQLLLCTLDKRLSRAASEVGVNSFPISK